MQPTKLIEEGSPAKKPCSHIGLSGTADELSAATDIKSTDTAGMTITRGPVPLYLITPTISSEIHAHGRRISVIVVKRTEYNSYVITLTRTVPQGKKNAGGLNAD